MSLNREELLETLEGACEVLIKDEPHTKGKNCWMHVVDVSGVKLSIVLCSSHVAELRVLGYIVKRVSHPEFGMGDWRETEQ